MSNILSEGAYKLTNYLQRGSKLGHLANVSYRKQHYRKVTEAKILNLES